MKAVIGLFPNQTQARKVAGKLEKEGFDREDIQILKHKNAWLAGQLLVSHSKSATKTGVILGAAIGGLLGFLGGVLIFSPTNPELPMILFGLMGLVPTSVIGGYIGGLLGTRDATNSKIIVKESLANEDAVLLVANSSPANELAAFNIMRRSNGDHVEIHDIDPKNFEHLEEKE